MGRADLDSHGRPIVVVTGTGVLTSLGTGKQDNWRELTAGHSGIHRITRFPIDGLRTNIAGTVDFIPVDEMSAPALSERLAEFVIDEAIAEAGIGTPGDFPGPMLLALPPVEMSGRSVSRSPPHPAQTRQSPTTTCYALPDPASSPDTMSASCSVRWRKICRCASAPRVRRLPPRPRAPRVAPRSSSASKRSGEANVRPPLSSAPMHR